MYINELLTKASKVKTATESNYALEDVERYVIDFSSWLHHAPVPARPILEGALFESSRLAEVSYFLAVHGFYEEACAVLRELLEGFLTRLYWDIKERKGNLKGWVRRDRRSTNEYWEWESGKTKSYPKLKDDIKPTLMGDNKVNSPIWKEITNQLASLNKFVHGRPASRHYPGASRSSLLNVEFKKKHFEEWYDHFKAVSRLVSALLIRQYPEWFENRKLAVMRLGLEF